MKIEEKNKKYEKKFSRENPEEKYPGNKRKLK